VQASEPDGFLWELPGVAAAPVPGLRVHAPPAPAHHQGRGVSHHDRHRRAQRHCFQVNLHLRCSASTWYPMFFQFVSKKIIAKGNKHVYYKNFKYRSKAK
jgi:hypothetical protein